MLAREFERALDFWSQVVDLDWHEVESGDCTIQLVDGTPDLFRIAGTTARAQFPDRANFQGWVAFNPAARLPAEEYFLVAVHEIGHLLGLSHSNSSASVMYFLELDGSVVVDADDLATLAKKHRLRRGLAINSRGAIRVQQPSLLTLLDF